MKIVPNMIACRRGVGDDASYKVYVRSPSAMMRARRCTLDHPCSA